MGVTSRPHCLSTYVETSFFLCPESTNVFYLLLDARLRAWNGNQDIERDSRWPLVSFFCFLFLFSFSFLAFALLIIIYNQIMCTGSRTTIARHHTPHSIKIITKGSTCVVNLFLLKKKTKPTIFLAATRVSTIYCWYIVTIVRLHFNICLTTTKSACLCMQVSLYSSSRSLLPFKLGRI